MTGLHKNKQGFGTIEGILIVAVVVLLGVVGFMVYKNSNEPATPSHKVNTTPVKKTTPPTTSYFTIKEWGVRAPYDGQDTLTYKLSNENKLATVISKQLADKDPGCAEYGAGTITRLSPSDGAYADRTGPAVEEYAKQTPDLYTHIGNYYYQFDHDQAQCGNISLDDQNKANNEVKALVASLKAVPN
jgi:hypothetical protein